MRLVGALILLDSRLAEYLFLVQPDRAHLLAGFLRAGDHAGAVFLFVVPCDAEQLATEFAGVEAEVCLQIATEQETDQIAND